MHDSSKDEANPQLPELPGCINRLRMIRGCESEAAAQVALEDFTRAYGLQCYEAGVAAGRENAATICDNVSKHYTHHYTKGAHECAAAIRKG